MSIGDGGEQHPGLGSPISGSKKPSAPSDPNYRYELGVDISSRGYTDRQRINWLRNALGLTPTDQFPRAYLIRRWCHANWHNYAAPLFTSMPSAGLSITKWILSISHLFAPFAVAVYAGIIDVPESPQILRFAVLYFSVMVAVEYLHRKREKYSEALRDSKSRRQAKISWEYFYSNTRKIIQWGGENVEFLKDTAKRDLANWMIETIVHRTSTYDATFQINIFLYADESCEKLRACVRAPVDNERNPEIDVDGSVLNWVAKSATTISLASTHYSWHPFDLQPPLQNNSKHLIPLAEYADDGIQYSWGVISIECSQPFFFHSRKGRIFDDVILPLTSLIKLVISEPLYKRKVDSL